MTRCLKISQKVSFTFLRLIIRNNTNVLWENSNETILVIFQHRLGLKFFFPAAHCLKITQNVAFDFFLILAFSTNFCPIKTDLSGNTV